MDTLQTILFVAPVLLFSVIAHEIAHGYAALWQGDPTAKQLGRLSWNPLKHIDPFLTFLMPVLLYYTMGVALGGAKPVPVNPQNYRNYRRGDIIVSLAGVATNLVLAVLFTLLTAIVGLTAKLLPSLGSAVGFLQVMFIIGIQLNLSLVVFNLLPIPPLDGSHVVKHLLPPAWAVRYERLGFVGLIVIVVILRAAPGFLSWWFAPANKAFGTLASSVRRLLTPAYYSWVT